MYVRYRREARVLQAACGERFDVWGVAPPTEGAAGGIADVIYEDDHHVGRARRRPEVRGSAGTWYRDP